MTVFAGFFSLCDINQDGVTNAVDIQRIINESLGSSASVHDLNQDGKVTVLDVQLVLNAVLNSVCAVGPQLTVTDFEPKSGPIGTLVTLTGTNFGNAVQVAMPKQGGGSLAQPLSAANATSATIAIAAGSATGLITLTNGTLAGSTAAVFTVTPSSNFTLTAAPSSVSLIQGQSVTYAVKLTSLNNFGQLAALTLGGVPAGVSVSVKPQSITAGQTAVVTLTAPTAQPVGTANLSVTAAATVDGIAVTQTAPISLAVVAPTTTFLGRAVVADAVETPLAGVTVTTLGLDGGGHTTGCTGHTVVSDAAGNFALTNLPASCIGPQLIGFNGNTVTSPTGTYAGVNLVFTLALGQVVVSPVLVHMPRIDNVETFPVTQNASVDQSYSFSSIPGLSVTVYAGTTLTAPDGSQPNPFPLAAINVPVDRLPDAMPLTNSMVTAFIVAFQPANTVASQAVAVSFPNSLNTAPGTDVPLMTLDPTRGRMVAYGTGTVSSNGATILPDIDPSTGSLLHRFGIVHFDWHGPATLSPPAISTPCGCDNGESGDPVDLASGMQMWTSQDLALQGNRGSLLIERTYRTGSTQTLAFGVGFGFNYDYRLDVPPQGSAMVNLQMPNGVSVPFISQPNGTLINQTIPDMAGAVMTPSPDSSQVATLRFRTGSFWTFNGIFLASIGDPNGNVITIVRDTSNPFGTIAELVDPVGRKLTFTYNTGIQSNPSITSITDPLGRSVHYTYNAGGYMTGFTDVLGGVTTYAYDAQNRLVSVTDPRGIVVAKDTYDTTGRVATQTTPSGGTIHFAYTLTNALVPTSPAVQTVVTDALGNSTTYRFNPQGYIQSVTDATGQTRVLNRAPGTNLLVGLSGAGACDVCGNHQAGDMTFTYDANGNMTSKTDALGNTWHFVYDPIFNQITSISDPAGNTATHSYDSRGNLIKSTDARSNNTVLTRDANGLVTAAQDEAGGVSQLTYDSLGNLVSESDPSGNTTQFSYDAVSRMIAKKDAQGHLATVAYNAADEATQMQDANGHTLQYSYDIGGFPTNFIDSNGGKTSLAYDQAGRISSRTDPLNRVRSYRYDLNSNLVGLTNRRGQQATFAYDVLNRPVSETFPDATVQVSYDANGHLVRVVDSQAGTFSLAYDIVGRVVSKVDANGTVSYTRDADERVVSRQVQGQPKVTYTYDANSNLAGASMGAVSTTRTYDARNLPLKNTRSNGVTSSYSYDAVGRLLAISEQAGNTTLFSRAFNYDAVGNIVGNAADMGLPLATPAATATFDAASEVTAFGGTTYTTDADGNRLTETSAAGTTAYSWDSRGRLQSILAPGGALTSFVYDPGGNMIQQQVSSAGQITLQRFIWDDADNVVSIAQGQTVTSILDGRGVDDVIAAVQGGVPQLPLLDQVSSEGAFTDGTGHVVGREFYEPYGASTSSGAVGQFLYAGRPSFNGNLFYNRARFYDSTSGRFLSEDPMGLDGGSKNLYRYGDNSPISSSDPYGLDVWVEHGTHDQAFGIHQKICVGQYGMRGGQSQAQCYSFGLSGDGLSGRFPAGGDGEFGPDDIRSYRRVSGLFKQQTHQQDQKTIEGLMKLDNKHAPYFLIGANCIVVAKMLFDSVMEDGGLPPDTHLPGYTDDAVRAGKWVLQTDYQIFKAVVPGGFLLR